MVLYTLFIWLLLAALPRPASANPTLEVGCGPEQELLAEDPPTRFPEPIPFLRRQREYPNAQESGGNLFAGSDKFSPGDLAEGRYVYLIARRGQETVVMWSPEAVTGSDRNLITHTSLVNAFKARYGEEPVVVGAGQTRILNGRVAEFDNRAGTRRGGPTHLAFAEEELKARGLPIEAGTNRRDWSVEDDEDSHHNASKRARHLRESESAGAAPYREMFSTVYRNLYRQYPEFRDPETPGKLLLSKIFDEERIKKERGKLSAEESMALLDLRYMMSEVQARSSEFAAVGAAQIFAERGKYPTSYYMDAYRLVKRSSSPKPR